MTDEDLDRLAALIAAELRRARVAEAESAGPRPTWLPSPVRPEPPVRGHDPAPWTGAAQVLGDVAPVRVSTASRHRSDVGAATAAIRAAAAGTAAPHAGNRPQVPAVSVGTRRPVKGDSVVGATVPIGISNRHIHLSSEHAARLFGSETLTVERTISQPGQFAATQRVTVHGASGRIDGVRVVGPPRGETQLELAASDARTLGVAPPVQASGTLAGSLGGLRLEGPAGSIVLDRGVIVPRRHLHLAVADGERLRLADGDVVSVRCGVEPRAGTLHGILVRCGPSHATELHLDVDEARALGLATGDLAVIASRDADPSRTRRLITERDVRDLFARGAAIPAGALLTPSARDRARALGMRAP